MDDLLKEDLEAFDEVEQAEADQRKSMLEVLRFVKLGEQWHEADIAKRKKEGRPCLTINRLPAFGKQVLNDARQNRPSIACHPVGDGADKDTAEILQGLIRNIEYTSSADIAYDTALDFSVNCGIGYATVNIDYSCDDTFDKDIKIDRVVNPFAVYGDPSSKAADSSDWESAFVIDDLAEDEFKKRHPKAKSQSDFQADGEVKGQDWFGQERVRIAERWTREKVPTRLLKLSNGALMMEAEFLKLKDILDATGITVEGDRATSTYKVLQRIITGAEILESNVWAGKYIPIIPCYGDEVNIEGKRSYQGLFQFAMDVQRNYNYWRTASTELVALSPKAPWVGPIDAFSSDSDKWATANSEAHQYIGYDGPTAPQRQPFAGVPAGSLQEAMSASDDLKNIMGLHDASLGKQGNETSGRAILARQREGDIATFNFIDNQRRFIEHIGRVLVDLIPKVYDVARIIRVMKEDGSNYAVPVNQPVQQQAPQGENGAPPLPGQPPQYKPVDPEQQQEIEGLIKTFDLTAGKYDVVCASGPSFTSRREQAAEQMMQFIQSNPATAPLIGDLIAKNLDWPGADEIAKRLQGMLPPGAAGKNPQLMQAEDAINQLKGQMQQMGQQLEEKRTELSIKQFEAETKRMQLQGDGPTPTEPVDHSFEQWKTEMQISFDKWKTEQDNAVKVTIAQMSQQTTMDTTTMGIEAQSNAKVSEQLGPVMEQMAGLEQGLQAVHAHMTGPRKKVRDAAGKLIGVDINGTVVPITE